MKKIYLVPQMMVVQTKLTNIIASSPNVTINSDDSVNAADVETKESGNWSNIWE